MTSFHAVTFELLGTRPRTALTTLDDLVEIERRLGMRLPLSVREWYSSETALSVLAAHSNDDPPIPVREFELTEASAGRLIPIRRENQGVCTWAILLDGSDDPPVYVDVDSDGREWQLLTLKFSTYVYTCIWDYHDVLRRPGLVQAQNGPLTSDTLDSLEGSFDERPRSFGWPGSTQYRFAGDRHGVIIWSTEGGCADWFIGAADATSLESALRIVWDLDGVGKNFYACSEGAREVLDRLKVDT